MSKRKTLREIQWWNQLKKDMRQQRKKWRDELIAQTTLEQRKFFIEALRESGGYDLPFAMKKAEIDNTHVALEVWVRNSRPSKNRDLVPPEKVR